MTRSTLEIAVDARGVEQGARQAERALKTVGREAAAVEQETKKVGRSFDDFRRGLTTGADFVRTSRALSETARALRSMNTSAFGSTFSVLLNDVGLLAGELDHLRHSAGGTTTIMQALFSLAAKNPLITIATVLGAATTAMTAFSHGTEDARDALRELIAEGQRARSLQDTLSLLNRDTSGAERSRVGNLVNVFGELRGRSSVSLTDVQRTLQAAGQNGNARQLLTEVYGRSSIIPATGSGPTARLIDERNRIPSKFDTPLTPELLERLFQTRIREIELATEQRTLAQRNAIGFGQGNLVPFPNQPNISFQGAAGLQAPQYLRALTGDERIAFDISQRNAQIAYRQQSALRFGVDAPFAGTPTPIDFSGAGVRSLTATSNLPEIGRRLSPLEEFDAERRRQEDAQRRADEERKRSMAELQRQADAVATTLTGAILAFADGATKSSQIMRSIINQFAATGIRQAITGALQGAGGAGDRDGKETTT